MAPWPPHRVVANHIWHQISKALKPSRVEACSRVPLCQLLKCACRKQQATAHMLRRRYIPSIAAEMHRSLRSGWQLICLLILIDDCQSSGVQLQQQQT